MIKAYKQFLLFVIVFISCDSSFIKNNYSIKVNYGMSHNDYLNEKPLFNALENGLRCIEVDLFSKGGRIYVAHTENEIDFNKTFEEMYLKKIQKLIESKNLSINKSIPLYLYLDLKNGDEFGDELFQLLSKYKSILCYKNLEGYHEGYVKILGNKWEYIKHLEENFFFAEAKIHEMNIPMSSQEVFIINGEWSKHFNWNGKSEMPIDQELKLKSMVNAAHSKARLIRFWGIEDSATPQRERIWKKLIDCGVDLISSDDLKALSNFHQKYSKQIKHIEENSTDYDGESLNYKNLSRFSNLKFDHSVVDKIDFKNLGSNTVVMCADLKKEVEEFEVKFDNIENFNQGIAAYLFGDWESWTKPIVFDKFNLLPSHKINYSLLKYSDNVYCAVLPICSKGRVATLGGGDGFGVVSVDYSAKHKKNIDLVLFSFHQNPYQAVSVAYDKAMHFMNRAQNLRVNKTYPNLFENIGWCTWNAMYEKVSESEIVKGVQKFKDKGINLPWLLIDDGWLKIKNKKLVSFDFDKNKFPQGIAPVVKHLNKLGVKDVGVWHTMNGYWNGVSKDFDQTQYKSYLVQYRDKESVHDEKLSDSIYNIASFQPEGFKWFDSWHRFLKNNGINFIKVDQQSVLKRVSKNCFQDASYLDICKGLESNLQRSVNSNFNGNIINCQNMAIEAMYNIGSSSIIRNSDDFFPERTAYFSLDVEKGNAAAHVLMNIHNSLWTQQIAWPDYDMFQSHHKDAEYHAILRAISGGPVYLSDKVGKQDETVIKKLIDRTGKLLRADVPAKPTIDCIFNINIKKAFKAFSQIGDNYLLAIWNTDDVDILKDKWSLKDINCNLSESYFVYEHNSKQSFELNSKKSHYIELARMGWLYYNIIPEINGVAIVGFSEKYNSVATIKSKVIRKKQIAIEAFGKGEFLVKLPAQPTKVMLDGQKMKHYTYDSNLLKLDVKYEKLHNIHISY